MVRVRILATLTADSSSPMDSCGRDPICQSSKCWWRGLRGGQDGPFLRQGKRKTRPYTNCWRTVSRISFWWSLREKSIVSLSESTNDAITRKARLNTGQQRVAWRVAEDCWMALPSITGTIVWWVRGLTFLSGRCRGWAFKFLAFCLIRMFTEQLVR